MITGIAMGKETANSLQEYLLKTATPGGIVGRLIGSRELQREATRPARKHTHHIRAREQPATLGTKEPRHVNTYAHAEEPSAQSKLTKTPMPY